MWDAQAGRAAGETWDDPLMGPMGPGGRDPQRVAATLMPLEVVRGLEHERRHRLVRLVALGVLIPALLLLPGAFSDKGLDLPTLIGILTAIAGAALAYLLNRLNLVSGASYLVLGGLLMAIAWDIASKPLSQSGLDLNDLRLYGLFVLPVILSGVLTGRRGPFIVGGIAIAFTIVSLIVLHKTPELQAYWDGRYADAPGMSYDVVALPVVILVLTTIAAWLGADSVRKALLGASRADELATVNERVLAQTRGIELQRRRLQDGIAHMQQVHAAFARGQFDARARVMDGELLPLAISLNQLLDRLQRLAREQDQRARMEQGARELAAALKRMRAGEPYVPPDYTGTPLDDVLVELVTLRSVGPSPAGPSRPFARPAAQPAAQPQGRPVVPPSTVPGASPGSPASSPSPSRAAGWDYDPASPNPPGSQPYRPDVLPDGLNSGVPAADVGGPASQINPANPAAPLDPRELLPEWLRGE